MKQEDIGDTRSADQKHEGQREKNKYNGIMIAFWTFVIVAVTIAFIVPRYIRDPSEAAKVIIESIFSLAVVIVVIGQTYLNARQARALDVQEAIFRDQGAKMGHALEIERAKTNPRLRVSKVRMENFQVGLSPIFITTIANDGFIDATGVELHIGAKFGHDREFKWINPQIVTIPARGQESYPIVSGAFFSEEDLREFNSNSAPIEVSVGLKYWPGSPTEPRPFCYRYLPWHGSERPDDIPQFVPCDFNPGINITLKIPGALLKHTAGINVIHQKVKRAETKGDSEDKRENPN